MKKFVQLLLLTALPFSAFSQKHNLHIALGAGFPMDPFGASESSVNKAAYAKTGAQFSAAYSYYLTDIFGLTGNFLYNHHPLKDELLAQQIAIDEGGEGAAVKKSFFESYSHTGIYIGPKLKFKMGGIFLDIKAAAGYANLHRGQHKVTYLSANSQQSEEFFTRQTSTRTFGFMGGAALLIPTKGTKDITIGLDYLYTNPKFEGTSKIAGTEGAYTITQPISILSLSLGLNFNLFADRMN